MPIEIAIPIPVTTPFGLPDQFSVWFKSSTGQRNYTDSLIWHTTVKRQNQLWTSEMWMADIDTDYVQEGAAVKLFSQDKLVFKGYVQRVETDSSTFTKVTSFGSASKLMKLNTTAEYTAATNSIFVTLTTGSGMNVGTNDNFGTLNVRLDNESHLKAIAEMAKASGYYWYESHTYPYDTDVINFAQTQGSASSTWTFAITGTGSDIIDARNETDYENFANDLIVTGYGDGVNQLKTEIVGDFADASYTTVSTDTGTGTGNITVGDTSFLGASGNVWIGAEKCAFTKVDGTTLNLTTRGVAFLGNAVVAYGHRAGSPVYDAQYTASVPEAGSTIAVNGVKKARMEFPNVVDQSTLDILALKNFLKVRSPIARISIDIAQPHEILDRVSLGDTVTVTDAQAELSGTYTVVGMVFGFTERMGEFLTCELSNSRVDYVQALQTKTDTTLKTSVYMQGATNIWAISNYENCDASTNLEMRFYLPSEAVNINTVKLNFKLKGYRSYTASSQTSAANSEPVIVTANGSDASPGGLTTSFATEWTWDLSALGIATEYAVITIIAQPTGYSAPATSGWLTWRVTDGTSYWPNTSGQDGVIQSTETDSASGHTHGAYDTATWVIKIPGNMDGKSLQLQGKSSVDCDYLGEFHGMLGGTHTHSTTVSYGINVESLSSPSVTVKVGDDDSFGSPTTIGTYTADQTNIDLTTAVRNVGVGKWIRIQFEANKRMRIEANAYIQTFVKSVT